MLTRRRLGTSVACIVVMTLGAAGVAGSAPIASGTAARPACAAPTEQTVAPPGVEVELELSSTSMRRGEAPRLTVTVRNEGVLPIPYSHSGHTHDFWIRDRDGLVWLWSQGKTFTDQLEQDSLAPGETRSARTKWVSRCSPDGASLQTQVPKPGRYVAQALWVSEAGEQDRAWWSNEVPFRIRPRRAAGR